MAKKTPQRRAYLDVVDESYNLSFNKTMTIVKNDKDKQEFIGLISDAFQEVMVPALDNMSHDLEEKIESAKNGLSGQIENLDRKFDAQQNRLDKHNERIETLEKLHPHGKHDFAAT